MRPGVATLGVTPSLAAERISAASFPPFGRRNREGKRGEKRGIENDLLRLEGPVARVLFRVDEKETDEKREVVFRPLTFAIVGRLVPLVRREGGGSICPRGEVTINVPPI